MKSALSGNPNKYLFAFLIIAVSALIAESAVISVNFRFDDAGSEAALSNIKLLTEVFSESEVPCTFAVIPYHQDRDDTSKLIPLSQEIIDILSEPETKEIVEIALHGYIHKTNKMPRKSEFEGIDYERQLQWITDGKGVLERSLNCNVEVFIPPYNRYDENTSRALKESGIGIVSASSEGKPLNFSPEYQIPLCCKMDIIRKMVEAARRSNDDSPVIVAYYHVSRITPDNNQAPYMSQEYLRKTLVWLKQQDDVKIRSLKQIVAANCNLGADRYKANYQLRFADSLLPPGIADGRFPYFTTETAIKYYYSSLTKLIIYLLSVVLLPAIAVFLFNKSFLRKYVDNFLYRLSVLIIPVVPIYYLCITDMFSWQSALLNGLIPGIILGTILDFVRQEN